MWNRSCMLCSIFVMLFRVITIAVQLADSYPRFRTECCFFCCRVLVCYRALYCCLLCVVFVLLRVRHLILQLLVRSYYRVVVLYKHSTYHYAVLTSQLMIPDSECVGEQTPYLIRAIGSGSLKMFYNIQEKSQVLSTLVTTLPLAVAA